MRPVRKRVNVATSKRTTRKKRPAPPTKSAYVTKRVLKAATAKAIRNASAHAMTSMGFVVKAENGWVIREDGNGKKVRLRKIDRANHSLVLD